MEISLTVNGKKYHADVEPNLLLLDFLRDNLGLTGTKDDGGSTSGVCTILLNGVSVKSSFILAVQADGSDIITIEGVSENGQLSLIQKAFWEMHAVQNGFCTPAMILSTMDLLQQNPHPTETEIRTWLDGIYSRDTGYQNVVRAIQYAAENLEQGLKSNL
jgi:aerobic carbon-monoxide dehydrogenase small subunit